MMIDVSSSDSRFIALEIQRPFAKVTHYQWTDDSYVVLGPWLASAVKEFKRRYGVARQWYF